MFAVVGGGAYLSGFGTSSVPILLPLLRDELSIAIGDVAWIVTAYMLTVTALMLAAGRLGDLRGHRAAYVGGFCVVAAGAVASASAPSFAWLVAARVLQGTGAAVVTANGPALLLASFPPERRGRVLGLTATLVYAGLTTGPAVAGLLARWLGWRASLAALAPLALAGAFASANVLPAHALAQTSVHAQGATRPSFDAAGALLFAATLVVALLAVGRGGAWGWLDARTLAAAGLALALAVAFARVERAATSPILPLDLAREPAFASGLVASVLQYVVVASVTILLPFSLRAAAGLDPQTSGWLLSVQPAVMMATAAFSGALSDRIGARVPASLGMAVLAFGVWRLGAIGLGARAVDFVAPLAFVGLGAGLFTPANNSSVLGAAPRSRQGVAGGMVGTARSVGMSVGVAAGGSILAASRDGGPAAIVGACHLALGIATAVALASAVVSLARPAPR